MWHVGSLFTPYGDRFLHMGTFFLFMEIDSVRLPRLQKVSASAHEEGVLLSQGQGDVEVQGQGQGQTVCDCMCTIVVKTSLSTLISLC